MPYLYGDATPFPLDCDFIECLRALLSTSVSLLLADEQLEDLGRRAERIRDTAAGERERVDRVAEDVARSLQAHPHAAVTDAIQAAAQQVVERARGEIAQRRDTQLKEIDAQAGKARAEVPRALERFFASRDLPETRWKLRYAAGVGERPQLQAIAQTPQRLELVMEVELPAGHALTTAPRVGDLHQGLALTLPVDKSWLRRGPRREGLDRWFVTEVDLEGDRARIVLRKSDHKASPGLELDVRREGGRPTVRHLEEGAGAPRALLSLEGEGAEAAHALFAAVTAPLTQLAQKRSRAARVHLEGRPVEKDRRPAALAADLVQAVAPLVRELAKRSAPSPELVLKRDLGNGRREETYVSRAELLALLDPLSAASRARFDALGLEAADENEEPSFVRLTDPMLARATASA
jgi:hypothetical protein